MAREGEAGMLGTEPCESVMRTNSAQRQWGVEGLGCKDTGKKGKDSKNRFPFHSVQNRNHEINRKENII